MLRLEPSALATLFDRLRALPLPRDQPLRIVDPSPGYGQIAWGLWIHLYDAGIASCIRMISKRRGRMHDDLVRSTGRHLERVQGLTVEGPLPEIRFEDTTYWPRAAFISALPADVVVLTEVGVSGWASQQAYRVLRRPAATWTYLVTVTEATSRMATEYLQLTFLEGFETHAFLGRDYRKVLVRLWKRVPPTYIGHLNRQPDPVPRATRAVPYPPPPPPPPPLPPYDHRDALARHQLQADRMKASWSASELAAQLAWLDRPPVPTGLSSDFLLAPHVPTTTCMFT